MNLNEYLSAEHSLRLGRDLPIARRIKCKNGLILSVQANTFAYCSPRENGVIWSSVEVGFPSEKVEKLLPYAEDSTNPTNTVYGYVPIGLVEEVIENAGGFDMPIAGALFNT